MDIQHSLFYLSHSQRIEPFCLELLNILYLKVDVVVPTFDYDNSDSDFAFSPIPFLSYHPPLPLSKLPVRSKKSNKKPSRSGPYSKRKSPIQSRSPDRSPVRTRSPIRTRSYSNETRHGPIKLLKETPAEGTAGAASDRIVQKRFMEMIGWVERGININHDEEVLTREVASIIASANIHRYVLCMQTHGDGYYTVEEMDNTLSGVLENTMQQPWPLWVHCTSKC